MTPAQLLALFLPEVEQLAELEAKALGKQYLPKFIEMLQNAENKLGNPTVIQFKKELEKEGEILLLDAAKQALSWCNS